MGRRYRVCQYVEDQETRLALCEVMTEEDGTTTCLRVASTQVFATIEDLKRGLEQMRSGCELPVLTVTQLSDDIDESVEAIGPPYLVAVRGFEPRSRG